MFLFLGFSSWLPEKQLVVGTGGYSSTNANSHLKWISEKQLELVDSGLLNLGSTWYGQSEMMVATARSSKILFYIEI